MIDGLRGAWINNYNIPSGDMLAARAPQVDYLIIKAHPNLIATARSVGAVGKPWLAEIYPYQDNAESYAIQLDAFSRVAPGCVGVVFNFEDSDDEGDWDSDDGTLTRRVITEFTLRSNLPVYASLDTRGRRCDDPYQRVCAELCAGVMPMVYPGAFQQTPADAFDAAIVPLLYAAWGEKPIYPTIQVYGNVGGASVDEQARIASLIPFRGYSAYTLPDATDSEWLAFIHAPMPHLVRPDALTLIMDNIIVPLAYGQTVLVQKRLKLLYKLGGRNVPMDWRSNV